MSRVILIPFALLSLCAPSCGGCSVIETDDTEITSESLKPALRAIEEQVMGIPNAGPLLASLPQSQQEEFLDLQNQMWTLARGGDSVPAATLAPIVSRHRELHVVALNALNLDPETREFLGLITAELERAVITANEGN